MRHIELLPSSVAELQRRARIKTYFLVISVIIEDGIGNIERANDAIEPRGQ